MRHQERIYDQTDIFVRNKAINNVNMSSDFCIFKSPTFDVQGATKVHCNTLECTLSGYSFANMLTAATSSCFTTATTACYLSTNWQTQIIADNNVVYNSTFYTTTNMTGDTPSNASFINAVEIAYNSLGYSYTFDGVTFSIDKPYGVKDLELDVCITFLRPPITCPVGFSATPAGDACEQILTTAATFNGTGTTIPAGQVNGAYINYGAYFYPSIQNDKALPVFYIGNASDLRDQTGGTITALNINNTPPFWGNPLANTTDSRLNNVGLSAASGEYVGFSKCINIAVAGTYYVAIAADNNAKFTVNGVLYAALSGSQSDNFKKWSVFPFNLMSGKNIIELYGENDPSTPSAFGAEIYAPISYAALTGATNTGSTGANVIFSTANFVGQQWNLGSSQGYSCPAGYALDGCSGAFICTKITITAGTNNCSGTCSADCTTICSQEYDFIDSTSPGVYLVEDGLDNINVTFDFSGNTDVFLTGNANFKFEVYKFNPTSNIFTVPPVYRSPLVSYNDFSSTNLLSQSIPMTSLNLDGDYLIKGYFEADVCTDFLSRLGKRIDTVIYKQGSAFQLYEPDLDFYFVAVQAADVPTFTPSSTVPLPINNTLPIFQQVIIINNASPSGYTGTGSTITLDSEIVGDIIVTLNGATLAPNYDYTLVNNVILSFSGTIHNGDVITLIYTKTSVLTIISETLKLTTVPSGTTNHQGTSKYYYDTTTGKYEIYTQNQILNFTNALVMVNGATLVSQVDFYQSVSNLNRIIMNGVIKSGDTVIIVYYPLANVISGVRQNITPVSWNIEHAPQLDNGQFTLQLSTGTTFSAYTISATVDYIPKVTTYTGNLILTGTVGSFYYYRVQNIKSYRSICGDIIGSTAYSETVLVEVESNAINSY